MKKLNKKSLVLLICAALLLTFTVSGTVAYLVADTDPVENVFTPASVDTEIFEEVSGNTKSVIKVTNAQNSIDVFVRVAVIGNWVKDGQVVESWTPAANQFNLTDWVEHDGFYYFKSVVAPRGATSDLLATNIVSTTRESDGAHLEVTVIHQSIQAEPETTVEQVWRVNVENGVIQ